MTRRARLWVLLAGGAGLAVLLVVACLRLPHFGGDRHPYGDRAIHASLARRTANTVSSVNFDQRAFDTLGEMTILFSAVLGCVILLRQTRDEHRARPEPAEVALPVRRYALVVLPVALLSGLYVIAHGQLSPGGGFQGGVVIASAWVLLYLAGSAKTYQRMTPKPLVEALEAAGAAAYVLIGAGGLLFAGAFLANFVPLGPPATLWSGGTIALLSVSTGIEVAGGFVLLATTFVEEALDERAEE